MPQRLESARAIQRILQTELNRHALESDAGNALVPRLRSDVVQLIRQDKSGCWALLIYMIGI